jgi:glycosyltransferase involved in cell wall biosynthesis
VHVAVDLRVVDAPGMETTGAGRYALEVARTLRRVRPAWRYSLFSNRPELLGEETGTAVVKTRLPTHRALARVAWLHSVAALPTIRLRPTVWFSPAFVLPLWWRGPSLVTIHDLTFMLLRDRYRGRANAWYATTATRLSANHADRVICGSQATRDLLVAHLDVDTRKIAIAPYGVADAFFAPPRPRRDTSDVPERPYLLFVGTWEARKGIATLYEATLRLNAERPNVGLVLAGKPGWGIDGLLASLRRDRLVELRERPDDEELARLYAGALALVYPSEMEGFGLPVAEAMACGCPVIASDLPSVREFAGEHPHYIAQGDARALVAQVERLLAGAADSELDRERARAAVAGLRWDAHAERAAELIEGIAGRSAGRL